MFVAQAGFFFVGSLLLGSNDAFFQEKCSAGTWNETLYFSELDLGLFCLKLYERPVFVFSGEANGVLLVSFFMVRLMTSCMFLDLPVDRSLCMLLLYAECLERGRSESCALGGNNHVLASERR